MSSTLSRFQRGDQLNSLKGRTSDLVIIGGGVLGAGIALDAAERGLHVVLIDKVDFGYGSSGKSSKLIHGGLNYFKNDDVHSNKEMLKERKILHQIAPNLVRKKRFVVPIYGNGPLKFFKTWYDLNLYEKGSELKTEEKKSMLRKSAILDEIPSLEQNKLTGGALVTEYVTDDCRLAIELVKTACDKGLNAFNYMQLKELRYEEGRVAGIIATDSLTNQDHEFKSLHVINATGSWLSHTLNKDRFERNKEHYDYKKLSHVVFPKSKIKISKPMCFQNTDGRMLYMVPRGEAVYVGTTESDYKGCLETPTVSYEETKYLAVAVNKVLPPSFLQAEDAISSWAGTWPVSKYNDVDIDDEVNGKGVIVGESDLITVIPGELTTYRRKAKRVLETLTVLHRRRTRLKLPHGKTRFLQLSSSHFKSSSRIEELIIGLEKELSLINRPKSYSRYLVNNYGTASAQIIDKMVEFTELPDKLALVKAELWYCVNFEGVAKPLDFFKRRTNRLFFRPSEVKLFRNAVIQDLADYFGMGSVFIKEQQSIIDEALKDSLPFDGDTEQLSLF